MTTTLMILLAAMVFIAFAAMLYVAFLVGRVSVLKERYDAASPPREEKK